LLYAYGGRDITVRTTKCTPVPIIFDRHREKHPEERRNDMLDLMITSLKSTTVTDEEENTTDDIHSSDQFEKDSKFVYSGKKKKEFDELMIVATALVITIAGKLLNTDSYFERHLVLFGLFV
jgi:hypothetical protein